MRSNIISAIHKLKEAKEHFQDFQREHPNSKGEKLAGKYVSKIDWIYTDLVTFPLFPAPVIEGVRKEWQSDSFQISAIAEKAALLMPEQRELIEGVIDDYLNQLKTAK
jgi:hypothetical protein